VINTKESYCHHHPVNHICLPVWEEKQKEFLCRIKLIVSAMAHNLKNSRWQNGGLKHSYYWVPTLIMHNHTKFSCCMTWHLGFMQSINLTFLAIATNAQHYYLVLVLEIVFYVKTLFFLSGLWNC